MKVDSGNRPLAVLLVEDNPADVRLVHEYLSGGNGDRYSVTHVDRLQSALECIGSKQIDVVLLDLELPDSKGIETFTTLHGTWTDLPIVMVTGQEDEELATQVVRAGAQDYLLKGELEPILLKRSLYFAVLCKQMERTLLQVVKGVSASTGEEFFRSLVDHLSEAAGVEFALVGELVDGNPSRLQTIAASEWGHAVENYACSIDETSFAAVLRTGLSSFQKDVRSHFPHDERLEKFGANGYAGTRLVDRDGQPIGVLAIFSQNPLVNEPQARSLLQIFAERAQAELMRRRTEAALRESERRFRVVAEAAADAIIVADRDAKIVFCNSTTAQLFGYGEEELFGKPITTLIPYHNRARNKGSRENTVASWKHPSQLEHTEVLGVRRDGTEFPAEVSVASWHQDDGQFTSCIIRDTTHRLEAEKAVRESEAAFRSLFEHATYGIYRSSREGSFLLVNPALVKMLGYDTEDELLTLSLPHDVYQNPAERERFIDMYSHTDQTVCVETDWKRKGGERITVRLNGNAVCGDDGQLECFEIIAEDVTERRRLEAQLRQAQKMEAIGQLTSGIAHDFNNLLSVILLNIGIMRSSAAVGTPIELDEVEDLERAAHKAAAMTKQLLGFSRKAELFPEPVNLASVVTNACNMLQRALPENISIDVFCDGSTPDVVADVGAVEQILMNLATNARDAMPDGGRLEFAVRELCRLGEIDSSRSENSEHSHAVITVRDTGLGMDEATVQRIFDPFFTTKGADEGTGLGMAMVYGLMEQHRGFVAVDSRIGEGTTFQLVFPIERRAVRRNNSVQVQRHPNGGDETILLVEDADEVREVAERVLRRGGYTVLSANDGHQALEVFHNNARDIEIVVSDVVMPNMSGPEMQRILRQKNHDVPFLFVSGYSSQEKALKITKEHGNRVLKKPWTSGQLLAGIREVLDGSVD